MSRQAPGPIYRQSTTKEGGSSSMTTSSSLPKLTQPTDRDGGGGCDKNRGGWRARRGRSEEVKQSHSPKQVAPWLAPSGFFDTRLRLWRAAPTVASAQSLTPSTKRSLLVQFSLLRSSPFVHCSVGGEVSRRALFPWAKMWRLPVVVHRRCTLVLPSPRGSCIPAILGQKSWTSSNSDCSVHTCWLDMEHWLFVEVGLQRWVSLLKHILTSCPISTSCDSLCSALLWITNTIDRLSMLITSTLCTCDFYFTLFYCSPSFVHNMVIDLTFICSLFELCLLCLNF